MSCTAITILIGLATRLLLNECSIEHIPHVHIARSTDLLLCVMRMSRKHKAYMHIMHWWALSIGMVTKANNYKRHYEARFSPSSTDSLYLLVAHAGA